MTSEDIAGLLSRILSRDTLRLMRAKRYLNKNIEDDESSTLRILSGVSVGW